jgi:hypothetical protein
MSSTQGRYAAQTKVTPDKSILEIQRTLNNYGATAFVYGVEESRAMIGFKMNGRSIRIMLTIPDLAEFHRSPAGRARTTAAAKQQWDQSLRQRWRALLLVLKAKLEAVTTGIATFDDEFLAYIVLPTGETVAEKLDLDHALAGYDLPALMPGSDS